MDPDPYQDATDPLTVAEVYILVGNIYISPPTLQKLIYQPPTPQKKQKKTA